MTATVIISRIINLAYEIYKHAKLVQANSAQCQLLADRVKLIESSLKKLTTIPDGKDYDLLDVYECQIFNLKCYGSEEAGYYSAIVKK